MNIKPAIVIVAYRRLKTLQRLLKSVQEGIYQEDDITLLISIDYHPENGDVIAYAEQFEWKHGTKVIRTHEQNLGLRKHIIECGNYAIKYGCVILLEDDELVAPMFYQYTKEAQKFYQDEDKVAGVSLYGREWNDYECGKFQPIDDGKDVYFGQFSCTWGQSWTAGQWNAFQNWYHITPAIQEDDKLPPPVYQWHESWGKYFIRYLVETNRYYVIPRHAVCTVYGEKGTHSSVMELYVQNALLWGEKQFFFPEYNTGLHYDAFFESVELRHAVAQRYCLDENQVAVDLYGLKKRSFSSQIRYVLSSRKLNYSILESFDLNLRPHELNVMLDIRGTGIFLYDLQTKEKNKKGTQWARQEYDFAGMRGLEAIQYGVIHLTKTLLSILRK